MTTPYWAKLWIEILDDPKIANMPDWLFRKFIMFVLVAKEYDQAGLLRPVDDLAWRIRSNVKETADALSALERIGVTRTTADGWKLVNFVKRQEREYSDTPEAIRQRKHREKERNVTKKRDTSVSVSSSDSVSDSASDSLTPNIFKIYEQNIGIIPNSLIDELKDAESTHSWNWIERAFQIAVENNARKWSYIRAILQRWERDGFDDGKSKSPKKKMTESFRISKEGLAKYGEWEK